MFNTLKYAKELEAVGVSRDQAEAHVRIMTEVLEGDLATKQDMKDLEGSLRQDMKDLDVSLRRDFQDLRNDVDHKINQIEYRLTIKLGTLMTVGIGVFAAIVKLF